MLSRLSGHRDGVPVYEYRTAFGAPPVSLIRASQEDFERRRHIHDFPVLWYVPDSGVVYVVAAGEPVDPLAVPRTVDGVGLFFDPAALGQDAGSGWPAWHSHPLLFPFLHGQRGGLLRLPVPAERRPRWVAAIDAIDQELTARQDGYRQAVLAELTVLLIDLARLADDVVGRLRRSGEPLLAEVFAVIDRHVGEPLSLRDVAREVNLTAGHLTTVVRRRTGRTVQDWILERRMAEARTLLTATEMPIQEVARRVGMADAAYFSRTFRRVHGESPRGWRTRNAAVRTA
jgi:AraC-like DNA-binding protein